MVKNRLAAIINLTEDNEVFKPLTNTRPIAALPFAGRYRIIDFLLSSISHAGIPSTALFIGESGRALYDHIRSGDAWDFDSQTQGGIFTFSQQNWKLKHHEDNEYEDFYFNHRIYMHRSRASYVFVSGSKIIANVDIKAIQKQHIESGKDITVVYKDLKRELIGKSHPFERSLVFDDQHEVVDLKENEQLTDELNVNQSLNMYLLSVEKMNEIIDDAIEEGLYTSLDQVIQHYLLDNTVNAYEHTGYTANIDSIDNYFQANMDMLKRQNFSALFHSSLPILTKSKNGSPTYYSKDSNVTSAIIATGSTIYGTVKDAVVHRRVVVEKNAIVNNSVIMQGTKIGEGAQVEFAVIDKDCVIEAGAKVIGTPDKLAVIGKNTLVEAVGATL